MRIELISIVKRGLNRAFRGLNDDSPQETRGSY